MHIVMSECKWGSCVMVDFAFRKKLGRVTALDFIKAVIVGFF
jgi:hypothetical protein